MVNILFRKLLYICIWVLTLPSGRNIWQIKSSFFYPTPCIVRVRWDWLHANQTIFKTVAGTLSSSKIFLAGDVIILTQALFTEQDLVPICTLPMKNISAPRIGFMLLKWIWTLRRTNSKKALGQDKYLLHRHKNPTGDSHQYKCNCKKYSKKLPLMNIISTTGI